MKELQVYSSENIFSISITDFNLRKKTHSRKLAQYDGSKVKFDLNSIEQILGVLLLLCTLKIRAKSTVEQ